MNKIKQLIENMHLKELFHKIYIFFDKIQITNFLKKIGFYIDKGIKFILPNTIAKDETAYSIFKRMVIFGLFFFIAQGIIVALVVFIVVKTGGSSFVLPNVEGKEMFQAFNSLEKEGMNLSIQSHYFQDYPLGTIVSQEPKGGVKVKRGRTVSLVVNVLETSLVIMPEVTGKTYNEAMNIITNEVLTKLTNVKILPRVESYDSMYKENTVLSQIPYGKETLNTSSEIILTVNVKQGS